MKFFAAILLSMMIFFLVQPLLAIEPKSNCTKDCSSKQGDKKKSECPTNCNPFFTCSYCQYIVSNSINFPKISPTSFREYCEELTNPIVKGFPISCWHPPQNSQF